MTVFILHYIFTPGHNICIVQSGENLIFRTYSDISPTISIICWSVFIYIYIYIYINI